MKRRRVRPRDDRDGAQPPASSDANADFASNRRLEQADESATPSPRKHGLPFILNDTTDAPAVPRWIAPLPPPFSPDRSLDLTQQLEQTCSIDEAEERGDRREQTSGPPAARPVTSNIDKKRGRMCKAEGCTNYIVHKGLCCRHGGGKKCSVDGCESSAKHGGRCWKHGGSVECKVDGCTKKAKAKGLCWGHGGGAKCQADGCAKVAISSGLCWAHGGGKRCIFDGCNRPAFERTHSFCIRHYNELQDADYYEV